MGRIFAIANQKGGVGKSITAVNLSSALAEAGRRVLVVDVDPQGNTTSGLGVDKSALQRCIYDVLLEECPIDDVLVATGTPNLTLVPATLRLAAADVELVSGISREARLSRALSTLRARFDYVLLDCPPSLGLLTINAMVAADGVIVPIQCEFFALEGLTQLNDVVSLVQRHLNPRLVVEGVLMTMVDLRLSLTMQVAHEVRGHFGSRVYHTSIPRNIKLSEAPSFGKSVLAYDPRSRGAEAYRELAKEVIAREQDISTKSARPRPELADPAGPTRRGAERQRIERFSYPTRR